jgi:hypothetical protein
MISFLLGCAAITAMAQTVTLQDIAETMETLPGIVLYEAKEIALLTRIRRRPRK